MIPILVLRTTVCKCPNEGEKKNNKTHPIKSRDTSSFRMEEEEQRARQRLVDALNDPTGRKKLFLNDISFRTMDDDVSRLTHLEQLYCHHNPLLTTLPAVLYKLSSTLKILDASHCQLQSLPEELSLLTKLEVLNVSHNQLRRFVWECEGWVPSLQYLGLQGNPLEMVSPSFLKLVAHLERRYRAMSEVMLHPPITLELEMKHHQFFTPRVTERMSHLEEQRLLGEMLPSSIETCSVCGTLVTVGLPKVFVEFTMWSPLCCGAAGGGGGGDSANGDEPHLTAGTAAAPPVIRLPVFHPHCGSVDCHNEIQKAVLRQRKQAEMAALKKQQTQQPPLSGRTESSDGYK